MTVIGNQPSREASACHALAIIHAKPCLLEPFFAELAGISKVELIDSIEERCVYLGSASIGSLSCEVKYSHNVGEFALINVSIWKILVGNQKSSVDAIWN
jgi:hypothetical protein